MLGIMAFLDQRPVAVACVRLVLLGFHALRAVFPGSQAPDVLHHGRYGPEGQLRHLFRGAEAVSIVPPCRKTIEISQLQYTMADVSVVQVVQVLFPVVAQRQSPWSKLFV